MLVVALSVSSCSNRGPAPELHDIYDRLVEVIEESHEVNVLLFGVGLPTYPRGDAEDELLHRYYNLSDPSREYVTPYAKFATIEDMETAITRVYGSEYSESLMSTVFTGYADSDLSVNIPARYMEDEYTLYQNVYVDPLVTGMRVYDYASMEITEDSFDTFIKVSIRSYPEDSPGEWSTGYLTFVYERGNWYLNSPSC